MGLAEREVVKAGPIRVSANGRHFVDAQGQPFFWLGDTAWPLFAQYYARQSRSYLAQPRRKGLYRHPGRAGLGRRHRLSRKEARAPTMPVTGPGWRGPAQPNPAYFQHVDHLLAMPPSRAWSWAMLPTWGYYVNDTGRTQPGERPRLWPVAGGALQGPAQHRVGQWRRPHPYRRRGRPGAPWRAACARATAART